VGAQDPTDPVETIIAIKLINRNPIVVISYNPIDPTGLFTPLNGTFIKHPTHENQNMYLYTQYAYGSTLSCR